MKNAVKQTAILWVSLLLLGGLTLLILQLPPVRAWLWYQTGEAASTAQVKGLTDLAAGWRLPRPSLAPAAPMDHTDVNPCRINVFLEPDRG
ncbi:hypothetical protein RY27_04965, partial [Litorilinea aerophila]